MHPFISQNGYYLIFLSWSPIYTDPISTTYNFTATYVLLYSCNSPNSNVNTSKYTLITLPNSYWFVNLSVTFFYCKLALFHPNRRVHNLSAIELITHRDIILSRISILRSKFYGPGTNFGNFIGLVLKAYKDVNLLWIHFRYIFAKRNRFRFVRDHLNRRYWDVS